MLRLLLDEALALLSSSDWDCSFRHVYREVNFCADTLARMGHSGGFQWTLLDVAPPQVSLALATAVLGVATTRVVG